MTQLPTLTGQNYSTAWSKFRLERVIAKKHAFEIFIFFIACNAIIFILYLFQFDWLQYINGVFQLIDHSITNSTKVVVSSPSFYTKLFERVKTTPERTIANYILWRFTLAQVKNLPSDVKDITQKFEKVGDVS